MTITTAYRIEALPPERLAAIRTAGVDDNGNPLGAPRIASGGEPLRCCLRMSRDSEQILLISYRPFGDERGPYAEAGPVFVHSDACAGYPEVDAYPPEFRDRMQVFRCYDYGGNITGGQMRHATEAEAAISELFADSRVERIHSRNVVYGCFMFGIGRR
jgi:hypothetical protein